MVNFLIFFVGVDFCVDLVGCILGIGKGGDDYVNYYGDCEICINGYIGYDYYD